MDSHHWLFISILAIWICFISATFVNIHGEPSFGASWVYQYDQHKGIVATRNNYQTKPNDTCHVFKLTDQQRHDIHTISGQFKVEIMMYEAIRTEHGERMTATELNATSNQMWRFCQKNLNFLKYNFYV
ncbi:uncharacterized protein [Magallana gigas]|uniref:uncharacterized protein n=1 Tax=Magallana gigas TaxID=29159 RepID=UPI003342DBAC